MPLKEESVRNIWDILTVDLCGPWDVQVFFKDTESRELVKIWALTMVDETLRWLEIEPISLTAAKNIAELVDTQWFCPYPRPLICIHDNGGEFVGMEFKELLESYCIQSNPTSVKNPQSNAIHERVHLVMGEIFLSHH
mmetsp:Transcript_11120/g.15656  ORF Transcript_11120/g.15656 Transcript_11120/m.15656 type:complete len:138 (+) Transcript_11120:303-716(+)